MVKSDDIYQLERTLETGDPPGIAVTRHGFPVIKRVAPQLSGRAEEVRRDPGDQRWFAFGVEVEQFCARPGIATVIRHEDGNVADDTDSMLVSVGFQAGPLSLEQKLHVFVELDLVMQNHPPAFECGRLAARRRPYPRSSSSPRYSYLSAPRRAR